MIALVMMMMVSKEEEEEEEEGDKDSQTRQTTEFEGREKENRREKRKEKIYIAFACCLLHSFLSHDTFLFLFSLDLFIPYSLFSCPLFLFLLLISTLVCLSFHILFYEFPSARNPHAPLSVCLSV